MHTLHRRVLLAFAAATLSTGAFAQAQDWAPSRPVRIIVPIVGLVIIQATGTVLVGPAGYTLLAIIVTIVSIVGLHAGVRLFDREAILTRWR